MLGQKQPELKDDLRKIRKSAMRTMFLVVLLMSGFAPAICMWWDYNGDVPWQQQWGSLWTIALRTYPLTLSIAVIAMSRRMGWFKHGRIFFMGAVITAGASLSGLAANWLGQETHAVQAANVINTPDSVVFGPLVNSFNYLAGYYHLYGWRHFFAAILVGSFAGRAASRLIRHVPEKEAIAGYVGKTVEAEVRRRAA